MAVIARHPPALQCCTTCLTSSAFLSPHLVCCLSFTLPPSLQCWTTCLTSSAACTASPAPMVRGQCADHAMTAAVSATALASTGAVSPAQRRVRTADPRPSPRSEPIKLQAWSRCPSPIAFLCADCPLTAHSICMQLNCRRGHAALLGARGHQHLPGRLCAHREPALPRRGPHLQGAMCCLLVSCVWTSGSVPTENLSQTRRALAFNLGML